MRNSQSLLSRRIILTTCILGWEKLPGLAAALKSTSSALVDLDLSFNFIRSSGCEAIAQALSFYNRTLRKLNMSYNRIDDIGGKSFALSLYTNTGLTGLILVENDLSCVSAIAFGEALGRNTSLLTLDVSVNNIRAPGANALEKALRRNSTIAHLSLAGNAGALSLHAPTNERDTRIRTEHD